MFFEGWKNSRKSKQKRKLCSQRTTTKTQIPFLPINLLSTSIINDEIPFVKEMRRISIWSNGSNWDTTNFKQQIWHVTPFFYLPYFLFSVNIDRILLISSKEITVIIIYQLPNIALWRHVLFCNLTHLNKFYPGIFMTELIFFQRILIDEFSKRKWNMTLG